MILKERIEKLKVSLAEKRADRLFDAVNSPLHHTGVIEDFKSGADALAEVYRLQERINATWEISSRCKQNGPTREYGKALERSVAEMEAQLEALLKQMEEKV